MRNTRPVSALTDHLGYWMRFVSNHVSHAFARRLEGIGVTVAEWVVLRELYDVTSLPPSLLADRMGMTRGAVSKLAERLRAKGFIEREADPKDGRAHMLALTPEGRRLVPDLSKEADDNDADFFGHLSPEDRARMEFLLRDIVKRRGLKELPVS